MPAADHLYVDGPNVLLTASFATQIGLALHELMTNSIKYGALGGNGRVDLRWHVETAEERKYLVLIWLEEHGGRHVPGSRHGFGHTVLTRVVAHSLNGVTSFEILPGRVNWSLRAELVV